VKPTPCPPDEDPAPDPLELLQRKDAVRVLHPAQDVVDGVLWYDLPVGESLVMLTSTREAHRADRLPEGLALRHADPGPSSVSREAAMRWLTGAEAGSLAQTLNGLQAFLLRYVVLRDPRSALWLAAWTLGTWCYRAFRVFPYLSIRSAEKRCGKSRLLHLLARLGFNASPVTAHPTEALLYRSAARTGGVQLFDEVESLRGDRERFDALITVLNVGFERGGVVTRLERRGRAFVEAPSEAYAPRVLAGIAGLKETLEDRALPLFMFRKRRNEPVTRLTEASEAGAQDLREACALACLGYIGPILAAYAEAPGQLETAGIDDRAVDLWSPLLAVVKAADLEDAGNRAREVLAQARELSRLRDADGETGQAARAIEALDEIRAERGERLTPGELLDAFRARPGWQWVGSTRRLAGLLNALGLWRQQVSEGPRRRWVYMLDPAELDDLRSRYGDAEAGIEAVER
jgi:hypothetical protein